MSYSQDWLESNTALRAMFILAAPVISGVSTPLYISTTGYVTSTADLTFIPIIVGGIQVTESLSTSGSTGMAFGDLEIHNTLGDYDTWLDDDTYVWANTSISIYYGDPSWTSTNLADFKTKFQLVFNGVVSEIDSKSVTSLNIKIRDKLERLNTPISEVLVGNVSGWTEQATQDTLVPVVFGEVFNISPILIDPALLKYRFNTNVSERVVEIRDNGIPIYNTTLTGAVVDLPNSTFTLNVPAAGVITATIQGSKYGITYVNTVTDVISLIASEYGNQSTKLNRATEVFSSHTLTSNPPVGVFYGDRTNVLTACQQIASSVGAQIYMNRLGVLQIGQLSKYVAQSYTDITTSDMLLNSLAISSRLDIQCAQKIAYCKNYRTLEDSLIQSLPVPHIPLLNDEWLIEIVVDTPTKTKYAMSAEPVQKDTQLIRTSDAVTEATRLLDFYKTRRTVYKFTGTAKLLSLVLGNYVKLTHPRFGLQAGKFGQIISLSPRWLDSLIEVEVII